MTEWIYNRNGQASLIYDNNCLRSKHGQVLAWIDGNNMFTFSGQHRGWFKNGVFYDFQCRPIGFLFSSTEELPSNPKTFGEFKMPNFLPQPNTPMLVVSLQKNKLVGWSAYLFEEYFVLN